MLLYPSRCVYCGEWIDVKQHGLCDACRKQAEQVMGQVYCPAPEHVEQVICAGRYQGELKGAILRMKFGSHGQANLLPLAGLMEQAWKLHGMPRPDAITCVPISPLRLRNRGYDQSAEMAKYLAKQWKVPFVPALQRRMLSRMQSKLHVEQRWDNARKSFYLRRNTRLDGTHVLLVDDIVTTGASISCCAALLRKAGAETVWVLAAAKAGNA